MAMLSRNISLPLLSLLLLLQSSSITIGPCSATGGCRCLWLLIPLVNIYLRISDHYFICG
ncbi:hypothetical protein I7I50_06219 [Histoplasma capsulatum G186AR]|uniref:Uncharacterized protein n=1 Tax=Ajellomyces capsulatus TaxID=5037 RepID=A0A8H7Z2S4_AJECA|nr:hypothetical protein I7I52_10708 [Histoplasma capsulatum]QSS67206.1 hypothetical protein I7I50_06219 [Histoplasma capsulatum G186AR]